MASKTNPQAIAKRKLTLLMHEPLKYCLNEMEDFCLDYDGHVEWPRDRFLDRFSEAIRRSASLYFMVVKPFGVASKLLKTVARP